MKNCNTCKVNKPINDFYLYLGKPLYKCKECFRSYQKIRSKDKSTGSYLHKKIYKLRKRAKLFKIPIDLNTLELKKLYSTIDCYYCSNKMNVVTLDRILPPLGYVKNNVVATCQRCNRMKSNFQLSDIPLLKNILKELENRK